MNTKQINFDISFTPYTIDTYSAFTAENDEDLIIDGFEQDTGRKLTYDDIDWNYNKADYTQKLAEKWQELMVENIKDRVIKDIKLEGKAYSPREYNFTTDNCQVIFTVNLEALNSYIEQNKADYQANHIRSYDGFLCFMDDEQVKLHYYLHNKTAKEYEPDDYMQDVSESCAWFGFITAKLITK